MQLSPLQSRLAASLIASCLVIALYFTLFSPHFALAEEIKAAPAIVLDVDHRDSFDLTYEPEFAAFDRSVIGRAAPDVISLSNNAPNTINVSPGQTQNYVFAPPRLSSRGTSEGDENEPEPRVENNASRERDADVVEKRAACENDVGEDRLEKRQSNRTVFITANTCLQPKATTGNATASPPPQLTLYVSTSPLNQSPGPSQDPSTQTSQIFTLGAVMFSMNTSSDVYVGIYAPNNTGFSGVYNVEAAASVDAWYHSYDAKIDAGLIWVDSDAHAALLVTRSLTTSNDSKVLEALKKNPPYGMFAQNQVDQSASNLQYSYCGLKENAQIGASGTDGKLPGTVTTGITTTGVDQYPKQQFYFSGLNPSSSYVGILVMDGNRTVNGTLTKRGGVGIGAGGHVFKATRFDTKQALSSCSIIRGLSFCDKVEYAVPSNYTNYPNATALGNWYDSQAQAQYAFFKKNLAQIPCEAPSDQAYSLVRNCSDCEAAYKDWLCSVMMPRCEDINSTATRPRQPRAVQAPFADGKILDAAALAARNISTTDLGRAAFNSSRNSLIDDKVQPGPYQEVLPCADLCWNLVQSCPASMGFACPATGAFGFNTSYALRAVSNENGELACNFPGSAHVIRSAGRGRAVPGSWAALVVAVAVISCAL